MKIAIACGGTGGHTYPGLATARVLRDLGHDVTVLQAGRAIESQTLSGWDGKIFKTGARVSKISWPGSTFRTWREFLARRPDVVVAMGSYTSFPAVIAAALLRVPVVLHEANAVPGKAIAYLARFAKVAGIAFPEAADKFPKKVVIADVGMPLRAEFTKGAGSSKSDCTYFTLLVMGGSQGAVALNQKVIAAISALRTAHPELFARLRVRHLAGPKNLDAVCALYRENGLDGDAFDVIGYSNEMAELYATADFCISRAGASSCMELALAGLPALFVPMPRLAGDHQTANAKSMAKRGAGEWHAQDDLEPGWLADYLARVADDPALRASMRKAMLAVSRPEAAESFAKAVLSAVK